jgi:putative oxidoreductase
MGLGITALRAVVGTLFMGHGLQKLAGWFGGHGLDATGGAFEGIGLRPGKAHAAMAGVSETGGGLLLATGLLTPIGASAVTGAMTVAIAKVHAAKGVWVTGGGYEYNLVLIAAAFAITADGPGRFSLDERLGIRASGPAWAVAQLAAGALGATAVMRLGERTPGADQPTQAMSTDGDRAGSAAPAPAAAQSAS